MTKGFTGALLLCAVVFAACGGGGGGGGSVSGGSGTVPKTPSSAAWTSVMLTLSDQHPQMGSAAQISVSVTAYDANSKQIPAGTTLEPTVTLADSDTSGATKLSATSITTQGQSVTLTYDGKSFVNAVIAAGKMPDQFSYGSDTKILEPTLRATEYPIPSGTPAATNAGNGRIFANGDGSMTFLENGAIGHVTLGGQITETPLSHYEFDIAKGPDAHTWILAQTSHYGSTTEIARINDDGTLTEYPMTDYAMGPFVLGPDGNFWLASQLGMVQAIARRITPSGVITNFPIPDGVEFMQWPAAGPDGNIWFAGSASGYNKYVKVTTNGTASVYGLPADAQPCCEPTMSNLAWGPDGQLYTILDGQQIARITPDDAFSEINAGQIGVMSNQPYIPMAFGPDNALWFSMGISGACYPQVGRVTTAGAVAVFNLPFCAQTPFVPVPNAFTAGADGNLWYTRDKQVGKILLQ